MDQLTSKGRVQRGMLVIGSQPLTSDVASALGLKDIHGVLVNSVTPGGPGEKAGLKPGDVIVKLNGKDVNDPNTLRNEIADGAPGTDVTLTIERNGMQQDIRAKLGELTPETARAVGQFQGGGQGGAKLGVGVAPINPQTDSFTVFPRPNALVRRADILVQPRQNLFRELVRQDAVSGVKDHVALVAYGRS